MHTFVAETKGTPLIAFQAKNKAAARVFIKRKPIREELRALECHGKRVWDGMSEIRVRAANAAERRQLVMSMLSVGLMVKRIDLNFWVSLISTQI